MAKNLEGPLTGLPTVFRKGKRVAGEVKCQTDDCNATVHMCIGSDNYFVSTCPPEDKGGCGTTIHGRSSKRARHEITRLIKFNRVAPGDFIPKALAKLDEFDNRPPAKEPSDQLELTSVNPAQLDTPAPDHVTEEVEEPIHETDEPGIDPEEPEETDEEQCPFKEVAL